MSRLSCQPEDDPREDDAVDLEAVAPVLMNPGARGSADTRQSISPWFRVHLPRLQYLDPGAIGENRS